jgi:hypothetical protein
MGVMTALAPKRDPGDFHLRVGMDLLADETLQQVFLLKGGKQDCIQAAQCRWAQCLNYQARERLRVYRNKVVAHLSQLPADMKDPIISELFILTRMIANYEMSALQPYRGKPAVRNDRGDRGNVGIIEARSAPRSYPTAGGVR